MATDHERTPKLLVFGQQDEHLNTCLEELTSDTDYATTFKALKKAFRKQPPGVILFMIDSLQTAELCIEAFEYIRNGLRENDCIFIVAHPQSYAPDALSWIETYNIASFIVLIDERTLLNKSIIERSLKSWSHLAKVKAQYQAETDLCLLYTSDAADD